MKRLTCFIVVAVSMFAGVPANGVWRKLAIEFRDGKAELFAERPKNYNRAPTY